MLAHKHHVSGLGIGKYLISDIVGVGILKAARKRQKRAVSESLGHLLFVLPLKKMKRIIRMMMRMLLHNKDSYHLFF